MAYRVVGGNVELYLSERSWSSNLLFAAVHLRKHRQRLGHLKSYEICIITITYSVPIGIKNTTFAWEINEDKRNIVYTVELGLKPNAYITTNYLVNQVFVYSRSGAFWFSFSVEMMGLMEVSLLTDC